VVGLALAQHLSEVSLVPDEGAVQDLARLLVKVHEGVAGLLGGPFPSRMLSDSQDADAPAGVLDHGQGVGPGAGPISAFFKISHAVDAATFTPRPASSPWIRR
jgi:hypothetical protein